MKEAKILQGYKLSFGEYIDVAVVSVAASIMVLLSYVFTTNQITVEALDSIEQLPSIMKCPAMIGRLLNDLSTSPVITCMVN